ncbi:DUF421 domain-containing protein [Micromonospora globispora]|uniref:DUF421 domain-containing protein n=2 Tax=Micromonospora globispora TaxID=1450148 RepID=A0A317K394_9ACTN|nr:DUF421 domain-containing protein [Micromonospora globispora]PWU58482.1 DUF421 domain-containing protein [Micromonospora globispora]RQX03924.1 DUF421 domain-containing protein [Micromonospora globispora]
MSGYLVGDAGELPGVALKAFLLYVTAVVGLRASGRRTLAELSPYDFVAAVAAGAVVGRLPTAPDASYLGGALTLVTILTTHALITRLRLTRLGGRLLEAPPVVLVADGRVLDRHLRRTGMTRADLDALLREHGVTDPGSVHLAVWERRGRLSVLPRDSPD